MMAPDAKAAQIVANTRAFWCASAPRPGNTPAKTASAAVRRFPVVTTEV